MISHRFTVLMFASSVLLLSELHFDIVIADIGKSQHAQASALKINAKIAKCKIPALKQEYKHIL